MLLRIAGAVCALLAGVGMAAAAPLAPADIQATFFTGMPFTSSTTQNIKYTMVFTADGKMTREPLGKFHRGGKDFYRLRAGDFRFYFEVQGETLHTHYILHKDSLEDALFRMRLPVSEKQLFEQDSKFWKYLESLTK